MEVAVATTLLRSITYCPGVSLAMISHGFPLPPIDLMDLMVFPGQKLGKN